jgi:hypothetical protein
MHEPEHNRVLNVIRLRSESKDGYVNSAVVEMDI